MKEGWPQYNDDQDVAKFVCGPLLKTTLYTHIIVIFIEN